MAKGNGGTRVVGPGGIRSGTAVSELNRLAYQQPTVGEYIPVTDRGMNEKQRAYVTAFETKYRNESREYGLTVDKDGNIIAEKNGSKKSVHFDAGELPKDGVLTHIHPISDRIRDYGLFYKDIGKSFSGQDIKVAIKYDLQEIRAVTPKWTFSMKRPVSGWGTTPESFGRAYSRTRNRLMKEMETYARSGGDINTIKQRYGRLNVAVEHQTMKEMAKKYGFNYTTSRKY